MVLSQGNVNDFALLKTLHVLRTSELDIVLVTVAKHTPVALAKGVELTFL